MGIGENEPVLCEHNSGSFAEGGGIPCFHCGVHAHDAFHHPLIDFLCRNGVLSFPLYCNSCERGFRNSRGLFFFGKRRIPVFPSRQALFRLRGRRFADKGGGLGRSGWQLISSGYCNHSRYQRYKKHNPDGYEQGAEGFSSPLGTPGDTLSPGKAGIPSVAGWRRPGSLASCSLRRLIGLISPRASSRIVGSLRICRIFVAIRGRRYGRASRPCRASSGGRVWSLRGSPWLLHRSRRLGGERRRGSGVLGRPRSGRFVSQRWFRLERCFLRSGSCRHTIVFRTFRRNCLFLMRRGTGSQRRLLGLLRFRRCCRAGTSFRPGCGFLFSFVLALVVPELVLMLMNHVFPSIPIR